MLQTHACFLTLLTVLDRAIGGVVHAPRSAPTATLDSATVTGVASGSVNKFLGIPFAQPPTGNLRFQVPQAVPSYETSFSATEFGPSCPKQDSLPFSPGDLGVRLVGRSNNSPQGSFQGSSSEDCLTLNVIAPSTATSNSNLPVVVWIYGGVFETGGSDSIVHNGSVIVERAISLGVPAVYVSLNYRANAFGFLASQEVKDAGVGNLGLRDQRLAIQWVQKYIHAFGGDPTKVTLWGQCAGAISIGLQMLTNGGNVEGLFRAAFMHSGAPLAVGNITGGQPYYDFLVRETGCSGAEDTLQCMREAPYETLVDAVNRTPNVKSYQSVVLAWRPRVDGDFIMAEPQELILQGSVADIPFVTSSCDDEGTMLSFSTLNITTDAQFAEYIATYWLPNPPNGTIAELMTYYPSDPAQGSPFDTGDANALSPQFKRLAAFQGDAVLQAPRRFFLQNRSEKQNVWTYVSKRDKWLPYVGAFHGSDLYAVYGGADIANYLVRFVANLDPNVGESQDLYWPQYHYGGTGNQTMLAFLDGSVGQALITDTYRVEAMAFLTNVALKNPL